MPSILPAGLPPELLNAAFFQYHNPIALLDTEGKIVVVNDAFQSVWEPFGVPLVRSLTFLENLEAATTLPHARNTAEDWLELFRDNPVFGKRYTLHCPDGRILAMAMSHAGDTHYTITMIDVTSEYQARQSLEHSEYRYRLLVETISEGLVLLDANHRIVYANPRFLDMYGGGDMDILGRDMTTLTAHEIRGNLSHFLQTSQGTTMELPLVCKDNSQRHVLLSASPFQGAEGTPSGTFATVTDVTALRQASERQKQSEARYANIIANTPFGILTLGEGGQILSANPAFTKLIQSGDHSIVHSSADYWLPDMTPPLHQMMQSLRFDSDGGSIAATSHIRTKGSHFGHARLVLSRIDLVDEGYVMIVEDISEHHAMEEALRHASKLALLGEMSASMAHEISQPMNIIRLAAENALLSLDTEHPHQLEEKLETITSQSERLRQTVDHMQAFSRRETGPPVPFNVIDVAHSTLDMFEPHCVELDIRVSYNFPEQPIYCIGHPRHLEQVLLNLCHNAADAIQERRLKDPFAIDEVRIIVHIPDDAPDSVELSVTDSGTGILEEDMPLLFEPFFTRKTEGAGTGLGLPISLGLVHGMQGDMSVCNRVEGGCCFAVTLPTIDPPPDLIPAETPKTKTPRIESNHTPHKMTIMVVDDEPLVLREITTFLEHHSYKVLLANSGNRARQLLRSHEVDVLITDLQMPNGDGYGLISEVSSEYPHIGIIVSTGQPLRDRLAIADLESGADAILHKPISLHELAETLEHLA